MRFDLAVALLLLTAPAAAAGDPPPARRFGAGLALDGYLVVRVAPGVGVAALDALCRRFDVVSVEPVFPRNARHLDPAGFVAAGLDRDYFLVFSKRRPDAARVAAAFARSPAVERAAQDGLATATLDPNDPDYPNQWNLMAGELDCPSVWDHVTSSTTVVGIIDTGIDLAHADLVANLWTNPNEIAGNGLDDDGNGFVDDVHGYDFANGDGDPSDDNDHGTHVSGIVGAAGNNGTDTAGVLWSVPLLGAKVLDAAGSGSLSAIAQGVVYAADQGCGVTNMSLGSNSNDATLAAACQYAAGLDVLQVAAAGNFSNNHKFYPAAYPQVMAVMATDASDALAWFSNFGSWCDLCAPGDGILSLHRGGGTTTMSGTSMASPHVAGVGALMRGLNASMDRTDLELALDFGARDLGMAGRDATYGFGILSAYGSYLRAISITASKNRVSRGGSVDLTLDFPTRPNDLYVLLPGHTGRQLGSNLNNWFAGDHRIVPLNFDDLTQLSLLFPTIGVFDQFIGALDSNGGATAHFNVPNGPYFAGMDVSFSALTFDPSVLTTVQMVGGSVQVSIR